MKIARLYILLNVFIILLLSCRKENVEKRIIETYPDGKTKKIEYFSTNKQEIIKIEIYYPNGQLQLSQEMKKGKPDGKSIFYYPSGKTWSEGSFKEGKPHGERKTYYENGQLRYVGHYELGKMVGEWTFYDEQGNIIKKIKY